MITTRNIYCIALILALLCNSLHAGTNPTDPVTADRVTGMLVVESLPENARVKLDGRFVGKTPLRLDSVAVGHHSVKITYPAFAGHHADIDVRAAQTSHLQVTLSKEIYLAWRSEYSMTVASSILLPGKGQVDQGQKRGWGYFLLYTSAAGFAYYSSAMYDRAQNDYNDALMIYRDDSQALEPDEIRSRYRNVLHERDNMIKHKDHFELAIAAAAVVWAVNMIDVLFFTMDPPMVHSYENASLGLYTGENAIGLSFSKTFDMHRPITLPAK